MKKGVINTFTEEKLLKASINCEGQQKRMLQVNQYSGQIITRNITLFYIWRIKKHKTPTDYNRWNFFGNEEFWSKKIAPP